MSRRLAIVAVLAVGVVLLLARGPDERAGPRAPAPPATTITATNPNVIPDEIGRPVATSLPAPVVAAARAFFGSYTRVLYGRGRRIAAATPALARELQQIGANPALSGHRAGVGRVRGTPTEDGYRVVAQITDSIEAHPYSLAADFARSSGGAWRAAAFTVGE